MMQMTIFGEPVVISQASSALTCAPALAPSCPSLCRCHWRGKSSLGGGAMRRKGISSIKFGLANWASALSTRWLATSSASPPWASLSRCPPERNRIGRTNSRSECRKRVADLGNAGMPAQLGDDLIGGQQQGPSLLKQSRPAVRPKLAVERSLLAEHRVPRKSAVRIADCADQILQVGQAKSALGYDVAADDELESTVAEWERLPSRKADHFPVLGEPDDAR